MSNQANLLLEGFDPGDRVELSPATDRWMCGDRFGEVVSTGRFYVTVRLDRSGKLRRFVPEHLRNLTKEIL